MVFLLKILVCEITGLVAPRIETHQTLLVTIIPHSYGLKTSCEKRHSMELTVKEASRQSGFSTSHIARMLKAGRMRGRKESTPFGDVWYVDAESLAAYPNTRQKPGRKPKQREPAERAPAYAG
jgi:hypothetical protein